MGAVDGGDKGSTALASGGKDLEVAEGEPVEPEVAIFLDAGDVGDMREGRVLGKV